MKHFGLLILASLMCAVSTLAQRTTDVLDRGVVAVKSGADVFVSWRKFGEEYYDTKYNLYQNGRLLNETPLEVTNYTVKGAADTDEFTVKAVVCGVEAAESSLAAKVWADGYIDMPMAATYARDGKVMDNTQLEPNDVSLADVDGDGQPELLVKLKYIGADATAVANVTKFDNLHVYDVDYNTGKTTLLWWIDVGPNMVSGGSVEVNIVGYDWDGDGKAEVLLRGADNMVIHHSADTHAAQDTTIVGDPKVNTRNTISQSANMSYTNTGAEYLLYLDGMTGKPFNNKIYEYPLVRGDANDWGDGYGHRSSKYFFGAPFLDGEHPSIFLARGIYTRHKMIAYDVQPDHSLKERWYWECLDGSSQWYANGYHNYGIADVDWDGRDEIVYGSMVIDDNGKGLSTTGLGHGDAQHCSDLDPFRHGQEIFACNEDRPCYNYRDATTSKIYSRIVGGNDDGRCIAGNFTDEEFGAIGYSARSAVINLTTDQPAADQRKQVDENFRIYWDGDLCEETFNYGGFSTAGVRVSSDPRVVGWNKGTITKFPGNYSKNEGVKTCNDTKGTPSVQADMIGDWREELVMPTMDNKALRLYTTVIPSEWPIYTLWHDHQYRQAMVWQMCGYNQPPHTSYFLGKREGITVPPPPLTLTNRTKIEAGATITATPEQHVLLSAMSDANYTLEGDVEAYILTDYTPTWVQGNNNNKQISYTSYTHKISGDGKFVGATRLVKQGDGNMILPPTEHSYTGKTDVWAGGLVCDGAIPASPIWLNRFARLEGNGRFGKVTADFAAEISPGGADSKGAMSIDTLILNYGAKYTVDLFADDLSADVVTVKKLCLNTLNDDGASVTKVPVINIVPHFKNGADALEPGNYLVAKVTDKVEGDLTAVKFEGATGHKLSLIAQGNELYISVGAMRKPQTIYWTGNVSADWDIDNTPNFEDEKGDPITFVVGDVVIFDDRAKTYAVNIAEDVTPREVRFSNETNEYVLDGHKIVSSSAIEVSISKSGSGRVVINNINDVLSTTVSQGTLAVSSLGYKWGAEYGALGGIESTINLTGGTLEAVGEVFGSQRIFMTEGASIYVPSSGALTLTVGLTAAAEVNWHKRGPGALTLAGEVNGGILHLKEGTLNSSETSSSIHSEPATVYLEGGVFNECNTEYSYSTCNTDFVVPEGITATLYLDPRCTYKGTLTGSGALNVYNTGVRCALQGNWSGFEGILRINGVKWGSYDPGDFALDNSYGLPKATLDVTNFAFTNSGKAIKIGNVIGAKNLNGTGRYTIGGLNKDVKHTGLINGGSVTKVGDGVWTMTALQTSINKDVDVDGGVLNLVPSSANQDKKFFANFAVSVSKGTLSGIARLDEVTIGEDGVLMPGNYTSTSQFNSLKMSKVTIEGTLKLNVRNARNSQTSRSFLVVENNLYMWGGLVLTLESGYAPAAGDSIVVWETKNCSTNSATQKPDLPVLPAGLMWDTSDLYKPVGILRIKADPDYNAIGDVRDDLMEDTTAPKYDLQGRRVDSPERGAYIQNGKLKLAK